MVVETHLDPSMEINQNTPRGYRVNTRAGGVIPHQITLVLPLSHMAGADQITQRLSCLNQWSALQILMMNPNPIPTNYTWRHVLGLGLTGVLPQGQKKVIARSQKGQISLKIGENSLFLLGLLQFS